MLINLNPDKQGNIQQIQLIPGQGTVLIRVGKRAITLTNLQPSDFKQLKEAR